jgi:hypothetical protein
MVQGAELQYAYPIRASGFSSPGGFWQASYQKDGTEFTQTFRSASEPTARRCSIRFNVLEQRFVDGFSKIRRYAERRVVVEDTCGISAVGTERIVMFQVVSLDEGRLPKLMLSWNRLASDDEPPPRPAFLGGGGTTGTWTLCSAPQRSPTTLRCNLACLPPNRTKAEFDVAEDLPSCTEEWWNASTVESLRVSGREPASGG